MRVYWYTSSYRKSDTLIRQLQDAPEFPNLSYASASVSSKPEKVVISLRIDDNELEKIDRAAQTFEVSRNEMIAQCISFALKHLPEQRQEKQP